MARDMPGHARRHTAVSSAKMSEPIEMSFGLRTRMRPRNHVLGLLVCHEHCKNDSTDRDAIWVMCSGGLKKPKPCIKWGSRSPCKRAIFREKNMPGHGRWHFTINSAKMVQPLAMLFGLWSRISWKHVLHASTLVPSGEYDITICVRRRCSLMSNYFDDLLVLKTY